MWAFATPHCIRQQAFAKGKRATVAGALDQGAWAFLRTYVIRDAFLDGAHGLALAISNAEASNYKYLKLWWMGREVKMTKYNR